MTERFVISSDSNQNIYDTEEKCYYSSIDAMKLCDLLNEQHETIQKLNQQLRIFSDGLKAEIRETKEVFEDYSECLDEKKQLKEENNQLKSSDTITDLETEIMKLKTTIQQLRTDNTKQKKKLNTAMKENEHIKQTIKDMINTERTEIGKNVLKQLWERLP